MTQVAAAFERWPPTAPVTSSVPDPVLVLCLGGLAVALAFGALTARGPLRPASWTAAMFGLTAIVLFTALSEAPADGIRGAGPLALVSLLHLVIALRSSPRPLASDEATVIERTSAPEGH